MAKQSFQLDPEAVAYTDDEIVGKINAAVDTINRENAVSSPAVDLSGKDADDVVESATKKYAGVSGADFVKTIDTLEEITEGATKKHFLDTEKTKLTGVDEGATDDQTGIEIKEAYEVEEGAFNPTKDGKLAGIEEGAEADQTGEEVRDLVVALADTDRKLVITDPQTGECKILAIHRDADGKLDIDYDDVPIV